MDTPTKRPPFLQAAVWSAITLALAAFFIAGAMRVPFHGDESMWIHMSHDFDDLFVQRDVSRLLYSENPADPIDQELREINNPLAKYVISLSWRAAGFTDGDLNGYWEWGTDWDWNVEHGRLPSEALLRGARWLSAALAALGVVTAMALGVRLGGWMTGGLAGLLLVTDASFLLHTRRAMAEGTLLAFSILSIAALTGYLIRRSSGEPLAARTRIAYLVGIGLLTGLAVAAKLNGAMVAMVVAIALLGWLPWRREPRRALSTAGVDLAIVAGLALAVVVALSPFLWRDPLARVQGMLRDLNALIEDQRRGREEILTETPGERLGGLVEQVFWEPPAYYEDAIWGEWVGDEIARYEASPLSGWRRPPWARVALGGVFVVGLGWLLARRPPDPAHRVARGVLLLWLAVTALVTLIIVPFTWQRYYLPLWPGVALVQAVGLAAIFDGLRRVVRPTKN